MSIPYVIDGETDLDSTTINRWIENINTVPLASITGALEGYEPLQRVVPDSSPTRSQSLRGKATNAYWGPSEAVMVEDYGGRGDGSYDNAEHFTDMVTDAKTAGEGSTQGKPILFGSGMYAMSEPLILPRTGTTPNNAVQVLGNGSRTACLIGLPSFPTNRGMIEWDAVESRTWHNRIARLRFQLPDVAGVRAIWHKRIANGTSTQSAWTEWLQCDMEELLLEGNNSYHEALIDLEVGNRFSRMVGVLGDCSRGSNPTYSTITLRVPDNIGGAAPQNIADSVGIAYSYVSGLYATARRGGYGRAFVGRAYSSVFDTGFSNGSCAQDPGPQWDFNYAWELILNGLRCEGLAETAQFRFRNSRHIHATGCGIATPNATDLAWQANHVYVLGQRVVPVHIVGSGSGSPINHAYTCTVAGTSASSEPTWPTSGGATVTDGGVTWTESGSALGDGLVFENTTHVEWNGRVVSELATPFSLRGAKVATVDATCLNIKIRNFDLRIPDGGDSADELTITSGSSDIEIAGYTRDSTSEVAYQETST